MKILCALRGGPESEETIAYAVAMAEKEEAPLGFLYVVNLDLIPSSSISRAKSIADELSRMGEFILLMAQAQAAVAGVSADLSVRRGNIPEQILIACQEMRVETLIMGRSRTENGESFFDKKSQDEFIRNLKEKCETRVIQV